MKPSHKPHSGQVPALELTPEQVCRIRQLKTGPAAYKAALRELSNQQTAALVYGLRRGTDELSRNSAGNGGYGLSLPFCASFRGSHPSFCCCASIPRRHPLFCRSKQRASSRRFSSFISVYFSPWRPTACLPPICLPWSMPRADVYARCPGGAGRPVCVMGKWRG